MDEARERRYRIFSRNLKFLGRTFVHFREIEARARPVTSVRLFRTCAESVFDMEPNSKAMYKAYLTVFRDGGGKLVERVDPLNVPCEAITGLPIDAEHRSYELPHGTTSVGRGWPLQLQENRVSRTHGELNFSDVAGLLTVRATSMNPIFVKALPVKMREKGLEQGDTQSLPMVRQTSQLTPTASQDSNFRAGPNTSVYSDKSSSPAVVFSPISEFPTPLTSPAKKNLPPTPKLQKKQLSDLSAIRSSQQHASPFGINSANTNVASLLRVDSQIQQGGGYKIRGILEDSPSQRAPSIIPASPLNAAPHDSQRHQSPYSQSHANHTAKSTPSQSATPNLFTTPPTASQQTTTEQEYTTKELGDLEKRTEWTFINPGSSPFAVRPDEPGIILFSFIGHFGGPQFQIHIIKVESESPEGPETTHILNDESAPTQIVMVSSPPFDDHRFVVPSVPAPKSKPVPSIAAQEFSKSHRPSDNLDQDSPLKSEVKRTKSKVDVSEKISQGTISSQRPPRRNIAPASPSSSTSTPTRDEIASKNAKIDLSALDGFELDVTPPRKRRADEILPTPSDTVSGEASMPLEEFSKDAVQLKKPKVVELVTIDEGDGVPSSEIHRVASDAPDIIEIQEGIEKSAEKTSARDLKRRSKSSERMPPPPPRAKQLFDASSDDDADGDESESDFISNEEEREEIGEDQVTSVQHQAQNAPFPSSPPSLQSEGAFAMPQSPPKKLSYQASLMDVVEPSIPLPSLAPHDSRFMDMDVSSQPSGRMTRTRSRQLQQMPVDMQKEVSSMKGVKEMGLASVPMDDYRSPQLASSFPREHIQEEAPGMEVVEGGEGMVPQIQLQEDPEPYGADNHDVHVYSDYGSNHHHEDGGLFLAKPEHSLKRSDTLTPSIDLTQIRVIQMIGSGSCGEVYKATWLGLSVAVKKVFRSLIHESALKEFQAECNIMKRLRHPNIVLFLGITRGGDENIARNGMDGAEASKASLSPSLLSDSLMCLVTEYMPLGSLHDVLMDPKTTIDLMAILKMATDAAKGINYMHMSSPPIIHRDLKSHNLLVGDNFVVKVTDFGLAKLTTSRDDAHNTFCGTLPWAAPEVLSGAGYTVKADVYSFGVVLWELITRQEPYKGLHKPDIIVGVVNNELRPPLFPDMEPLIVELIQVCWAQDPEDRPDFQTIVDRLTEVTDYLYALHMERKSKAAMGVLTSSSGGELPYGSKWLAPHEPGSLDHHQQVKLAQEALEAGAQPERGELEEIIISAGSPIFEGNHSSVMGMSHSSSEEIQKAHQDALELMNSALQTGDMNAVFNAMEQVRLAAEGVARLSAQGSGGGVGNSGKANGNGNGMNSGSMGRGNGPSSHSNSLSRSSNHMNASFASRSKSLSHQWTLDLNELTSIEKLAEEVGPSFANRTNQSLTKSHDLELESSSDGKKSNLAMSGTTNVMPAPNDENASQKAYTAWHGQYRGQDVLVRVWHEALEASEIREFHKQLKILSEVKSSRVALFYGCVLEPRLLMVTEYTPHPSLFSIMTSDPTTTHIDWDIVITLALEISKAIMSLHLWKPVIVHRDIQSSKFIVDQRTWTVKMNDLGLARFDHASNHSTLSKMRGNFLYTAPEAYSGASYSTQSDVYSFGIVLWELVTRCIVGHYVQPFSEFTNIRFEFQLVIQVSKDAIRPSLHPDTPSPLSQLIQDCWAQDPASRPQIHDVASQLEQLKVLYEQETRSSNGTS